MSDISLETIIARRDDIMTADMLEELVMFNIDRGMYYGLQTVATFIWKQLDQKQTIAEVCNSVQAQFDGVEPEQCREDVLAFVNDLYQEELIDVREPKAA